MLTCTGEAAAAALPGRLQDLVPMSCRLKLSPWSRLLAEAAPENPENNKSQPGWIHQHQIPGL